MVWTRLICLRNTLLIAARSETNLNLTSFSLPYIVYMTIVYMDHIAPAVKSDEAVLLPKTARCERRWGFVHTSWFVKSPLIRTDPDSETSSLFEGGVILAQVADAVGGFLFHGKKAYHVTASSLAQSDSCNKP
jgi:hypothetical protein